MYCQAMGHFSSILDESIRTIISLRDHLALLRPKVKVQTPAECSLTSIFPGH